MAREVAVRQVRSRVRKWVVMERIPIAGPSITEREIRYVTDAVARCWHDHANEYIDRFECAAKEYFGVPYALALPSCTSAIHLALLALGIGSGDEVIVPDVTWIATSAPISYVGASPIFVDIDPRNWCLSVEAVEQAITPHTKAVIAVDLYGSMPEWSDLRSLCSRRGLPIIEDAAEAIGTKVADIPAGSLGDVGVFSFHGSKTMTTGEGGMLITFRKDVYERTCVLRDHGRAKGDVSFLNHEVAYKYKMSNLQAALGLAQLERIDELVACKQRIMKWYRDDLEGDQRITLNPKLEGIENSYWMSTALVAPQMGLQKEKIIQSLAARGIDSRPFFYPLSSLPAYADYPEAASARARNVVARRITPFGVNLPSALSLTRDQVAYVAQALKEIVHEVDIPEAELQAA
jgi:perosamine synthetase